MSILARYALATSLILVITFILFAVVSLSSIRSIYDREAVLLAEVVSETIISTTYHGMLSNDSQTVYQIISEVGRQPGVHHIRLINKEGIIRFSTHAAEIGKKVDKDGEACSVCHGRSNTPLADAPSMSRSRRFVDANGAPVLGLARGIYNEPSCSLAECHVHSPTERIVGVLDITIPLSHSEEQIAIFRSNFLIFVSAVLTFLFFFLVFVTHKYVKEPVRQLIGYTRQVSRGDFTGKLKPFAAREMQDLGRAFESMTVSLARTQQELRDANTGLEERVASRSEELRVMQVQLSHSERLAMIGEMTAGIAHEINNPLTSVMIFSGLLLKRADVSNDVKADLETILAETGRCAAIVRRLLEFSRATPLQKHPCRLDEIVESALHLLEGQTLFHNVTIMRDYAAVLGEIEGDRDQLRQVFMNILLNAAQAMRDGGVLSVRIAADAAEEMIGVEIADTGGGIDEESLARIFDPFFTTKKTEGTGLGLSVSFGIVASHDGRIDVRNRAGAGAVFTVWLPLY